MTIALICLCIALVVVLISYFKFNTFLVLFGVSILLGLLTGMDVDALMKTIKAGFGHTLEKIGLLIIFGVILGEILEKTQATNLIAQSILDKVGAENTGLAILLIGFLVGLPIFCDSGFIILSGLIFSFNQPKKQMLLTIALAGSLYAVHCLVPPHPGISVATTQIGADLGLTMLLGIVLAIPATIVAFFWGKYVNDKFIQEVTEQEVKPNFSFNKNTFLFSAKQAFVPIWLPIALMSLKAVAMLSPESWPKIGLIIIKFLGEPMIALLAGIVSALPLMKGKDESLNKITNESFGKAGHILAIIASGGIFGEVVKETLAKLDLSQLNLHSELFWIWIPFGVTFFFKTAQGSSTVAVMSASAILLPLFPQLGIDTATDKQLTLFAMGAGSMMISHANDAYFWVVSNFAKQSPSVSLKTYTPMTVLMGLVTMLVLWIVQVMVA